jgi:5'-deoxynucleotidase YfbR-like HD superfamily hydrolase
MPKDFNKLEQIQKLVLDIIKVERNHYIYGTERRENVVEHSFSLAMLCWRIFEIVKPPLDQTKIFKYALVHDFVERGQNKDTNTYADQNERQSKKEREREEIAKLFTEFNDFTDFVNILKNYEMKNDEEALFVWSIDKIQAKILGQIDNWRPYSEYGITYKEYCEKSEEFLERCSPCLKNIFEEVYEETKKTYYDKP